MIHCKAYLSELYVSLTVSENTIVKITEGMNVCLDGQ